MKEYWGVRDGRPKKLGQNGTVSDIAEVIGETERTTKRILKLNDLIPQLQKLVSSGKLGTTAAEQLAWCSRSLILPGETASRAPDRSFYVAENFRFHEVLIR